MLKRGSRFYDTFIYFYNTSLRIILQHCNPQIGHFSKLPLLITYVFFNIQMHFTMLLVSVLLSVSEQRVTIPLNTINRTIFAVETLCFLRRNNQTFKSHFFRHSNFKRTFPTKCRFIHVVRVNGQEERLQQNF